MVKSGCVSSSKLSLSPLHHWAGGQLSKGPRVCQVLLRKTLRLREKTLRPEQVRGQELLQVRRSGTLGASARHPALVPGTLRGKEGGGLSLPVSSPPSRISSLLPRKFWSRGARCPARTTTRGGCQARDSAPARPRPCPGLAGRRSRPCLPSGRGPMETAARGAPRGSGGAEPLLRELEARVQDVVRASSWWERRGVDCSILALSLLALPPGEGRGTRDTAPGRPGARLGGGCEEGDEEGWGWGVGETLRAGDPKSDQVCLGCPALCPQRTWARAQEEREARLEGQRRGS